MIKFAQDFSDPEVLNLLMKKVWRERLIKGVCCSGSCRRTKNGSKKGLVYSETSGLYEKNKGENVVIRGITYYSEDWKEADEAASLKEGEKQLSPFIQVEWTGQSFFKTYYLSITDRRLIMGRRGFFSSGAWAFKHTVDPVWELPLSEIAEIKVRGKSSEITTLAGDKVSLYHWRQQPAEILKQLTMKISAERAGASFEPDMNVSLLDYLR